MSVLPFKQFSIFLILIKAIFRLCHSDRSGFHLLCVRSEP